MNITIIGAGYVGLSTAAILANSGNQISLIDINKTRLAAIKQGRSFFFEEGIDPLIKKAVVSGSLTPTDQYDEVAQSDIVFSCVGTPDNPDGSSNLEYVFSAAETCAKLMKPSTIYVQKSTVPVGTGEVVQQKMGRTDIAYVSNPEFLREGTAIEDSLYFDRVVCGGKDKDAISTVFNVFKAIEKNQDSLAKLAGITIKSTGVNPTYISTGLESAELIKVTANAFLALKISFANSIAKLSDKVGADVVEVMDAVGQDKRIGRAFLNAGRGYGGGCFPKDVSGLISAVQQHGADPQILTAAQSINQSMPTYIVSRLQEKLGDLRGKKIAVLGLAFKAGTSDTRKSPGITIANLLHKSGAIVHAYDPKAYDEAKLDLDSNVNLDSSVSAAINDARAVLVTTEWNEFKQMDLKSLKNKLAEDRLLFDCMNIFSPSLVRAAGLQYIGIGR
jgi:UDPglucose 6-dehydrogenase